MRAELLKNALGEDRLWLHAETLEEGKLLGSVTSLESIVVSNLVDPDTDEETVDRVSFRLVHADGEKT